MKTAVSASQQILEKQYTASDKAVYLMENGRKLTNLFTESAEVHQDFLAMAKADILAETYRAQNIYHSEDQINYETGEVFEGYSVLVNGLCSRVSPAYLSASARRSRKRIRAKIAETKPLVGQHWRFMTLTLPYLKTDVATVMKVLDEALTKFKKNRVVWIKNVAGAFLAEEMTIGAETRLTSTHFNIHVHILMLGKYIEQRAIANLWTDCVERACSKFGVEFIMTNLETNRLITDVRDVRKYADSKQMTMDKAIEELCKYTTKSSEYDKVPIGEIILIEEALRNRQMVKTYGCFNNQKGKGKGKDSAKDTSLDTKCITDAIDNKRLLYKAIQKTRKRETLAQMGARLIAQGRRSEFKDLLAVEFENRREFRTDQLARRYPHATFRTLAGGRWFGVSKRAPKSNVVALVDYWQKQREKPKPEALLDEIVESYDDGKLLDEIILEYEKRSWLESVGILDEKPANRSEIETRPSLRTVLDLTEYRRTQNRSSLCPRI